MLPILDDTIECSCDKCVTACLRKPGWFLPEEIKPAADLLGITEQEFFNTYLSVDYYGKPDEFLFVLAPATEHSQPGKEYPLEPSGRCVFLTKDNKCTIHAAKPYECKFYDHRKEYDEKSKSAHLEVAEAWVAHKGKITELLGREPTVETDPLEIFQFLMGSLLGR